jgi:hypothetical protein
MKKKSTKKKIMALESVSEQAMLLAVLYVFSAFFALLIYSAGKVASIRMDTFNPVTVVQPKSRLELALSHMVSGHPMERMVPYIAQQDPLTATFLISIAKQESNWGKHAPLSDGGRDCYNYWGYRGNTENVTPSGYSCFRSPREAVRVVGGRLNRLIWEYNLDTPQELLVWKCGSSCESHNQADVARWQNTVGMYSKKIESESSL